MALMLASAYCRAMARPGTNIRGGLAGWAAGDRSERVVRFQYLVSLQLLHSHCRFPISPNEPDSEK
jgi:hypothetical protein